MAHTEIEFSQQGPVRNRWIRVTSLVAAAVIAIAVLWAAGMPPREWLARLSEVIDSSPAPDASANRERAVLQPAAPVVSTLSANPNSLPGTDASVSPSPLPLYLLSVEPGRNSTEGTAQIGTSPDNPQSYAAGALLANGARLAEIHSDHVELKRGSQSARLSLYDRRNLVRQGSSNELLAIGGTSQAQPVATPSREALTDYLRPSPLYDGEILTGYQVYPGTKRHLFSQLGLQPGDVIVAIDGMPLADPAQTIETLRALNEGATLSVTIDRNQRRENLTMDGAVIIADRERTTSSSQPLP